MSTPSTSSASATSSATAGLTIHLNDEPRAFAGATTVADVLRELGLAERKGVAVAVNNSVVPRPAWSTRALADGDRVLIIRATQGG